MTEGLRRFRFLCALKSSEKSGDYRRKYQVDLRSLRDLHLKYIRRKCLTGKAILDVRREAKEN